MRTHTGVATAMFDALAEAGVNIQMITTSEIKISVLVDRDVGRGGATGRPQGVRARRCASLEPYRPFEPKRAIHPTAPATENGHSAAILGGMEDLVISGAELDEGQARITVLNLPDQPGYAARLFGKIAEAGVFVDMIVQSAGSGENTHLSFTVPRAQAERAKGAATIDGSTGVQVDLSLSKLSVLGVGVRTHTGAAMRMFGALAERGINIGLINTSEVRINVATDFDRGREGLECLRKVFALPEDVG